MRIYIVSWSWFCVCSYISLLCKTIKLNEVGKKHFTTFLKKLSNKAIKFTISQYQNSLWTSYPSNPFHPYVLILNIEDTNQTLALGSQRQCNFSLKPNIIQSDLYWLISLFASPYARNNGGRQFKHLKWPIEISNGGKWATSSSFYFSRSLQVGHKG